MFTFFYGHDEFGRGAPNREVFRKALNNADNRDLLNSRNILSINIEYKKGGASTLFILMFL